MAHQLAHRLDVRPTLDGVGAEGVAQAVVTPRWLDAKALLQRNERAVELLP